MKKLWLCAALGLCLTLSLLPASARAAFADLQPGAYYLDAVSWAAQKGINLLGTGMQTFDFCLALKDLV